MPAAVIVDAVRTAGGKRNGKLSGWHPADLAGVTLRALVERNGLDAALVDDVIIVPAVSDEAAKDKFPKGWDAKRPYLRLTPQPNL